MQLHVEVSPPANRMSLRLTLTHVTFDLLYFLRCDLLASDFTEYDMSSRSGYGDMNFGYVTSRQTYRKWCIRAHCAYAQVGSKTLSFTNKVILESNHIQIFMPWWGYYMSNRWKIAHICDINMTLMSFYHAIHIAMYCIRNRVRSLQLQHIKGCCFK